MNDLTEPLLRHSVNSDDGDRARHHGLVRAQPPPLPAIPASRMHTFNKDLFKIAFQKELRKFGIKEGATNRLKNLDSRGFLELQQLNSRQKRHILYELNLTTTADLYKFKLQTYFDKRPDGPDHVTDCFYESGVERTTLRVNDNETCTPVYSNEEKKAYIENILFPCFSKYVVTKRFVSNPQDLLIYSYFIRFGCIFNPVGNILGGNFNLLTDVTYYLKDGNHTGEAEPIRDENIFSATTPTFKTLMYIIIFNARVHQHHGESFFLPIDYGNLDTLNGLPYKYILPTLLYMMNTGNQDVTYDTASNIQEIKITQDGQDVLEQRKLELEDQEKIKLEEQEKYMDSWFRMREQMGTQGGNIQKKQSKCNKSKRNKSKRNKSKRNKSKM